MYFKSYIVNVFLGWVINASPRLLTRISVDSLPDDREHEWIARTCRKAWDEIVGHDADI